MTRSTQSRPPRPRWLAGALLAAAFVAGGVTLPLAGAIAQGAGQSGMHGMMGDHSAAHAVAMAHVSKMLDAVGASPEQKSRIQSILRDGFAPMAEAHHGMSQTHARLSAILTAPTVDRAALEQLRAQQVARIDEASHSLTKALADAAEVLSPAQRVRLAGLVADHLPPS